MLALQTQLAAIYPAATLRTTTSEGGAIRATPNTTIWAVDGLGETEKRSTRAQLNEAYVGKRQLFWEYGQKLLRPANEMLPIRNMRFELTQHELWYSTGVVPGEGTTPHNDIDALLIAVPVDGFGTVAEVDGRLSEGRKRYPFYFFGSGISRVLPNAKALWHTSRAFDSKPRTFHRYLADLVPVTAE